MFSNITNCFQRWCRGLETHVIHIIYENNILLKKLGHFLFQSRAEFNRSIVLICMYNVCLNSYSSDVKQFNLTDNKYICLLLLNGYFVRRCVILSLGFCIQSWKLLIMVLQVSSWNKNSIYSKFLTWVVHVHGCCLCERTIFAQISMPLEYTSNV